MSQFDYTKDARLQRYTTGRGGTVQAILTHESVGPDYIAMWLAARLLENSSNPAAARTFSSMITSLATMYPQDVKRAQPAQDPVSQEIVWTQEDQDAAFADGWGVFQNDDHGTQIEHCIEGEIFANDGEARLHVVHRSMQGSDLHYKAIRYIRQERRSTSSPRRSQIGAIVGTWTSEDQNVALGQGWGLFRLEDGRVEVQRWDGDTTFADDDRARSFVEKMYFDGLELYRRAVDSELLWNRAVVSE